MAYESPPYWALIAALFSSISLTESLAMSLYYAGCDLYERNQEAGDPYYWPKWLDVEEPGVMVPVVRSPDNILLLVAGDPARSRSAYCPARPYNRPVTKKVRLP